MSEHVTLKIVVHGHVQGVYYRAFVKEKADELKLKGYARNLPSGVDVEIEATGPREQLEKLVDLLKIGPPAARVQEVDTSRIESGSNYSDFTIR